MVPRSIRWLAREVGTVRMGAGLLVLLSMLPCVMLLIGDAVGERAALLDAARLRALETARLLAERQDGISRELDSALALLRTLAAPENRALCNAAAAEAAASHAGQLVLSVTDATGRLVCTSEPGMLGIDMSDAPPVRALLAPDGPERLQAFPSQGRLLGVPETVNLVVVRDAAGRRVGVAAAAVPFDWLMEAARAMGRGAENPVFLIDATTGEILARAERPEGWVGHRFPDHTVLRAFRAAPGTGVVEGPSPVGQPRVFGFAPLRANGGGTVLVVAALARAPMLAQANHALLASLLLAATLTLLGAAAAWWGAHLWLLRPLRELAVLARHLGDAPLARPGGTALRLRCARELRLLHGQLRRRGRSLARARAALAESEAEARLLAEGSSDIILRLDREGRTTFVSRAVRDVLGVSPEGFVAATREEVVHPDDLALVQAGMARLRGTGAAPVITYRRRGARGWVWLEAVTRAAPGGVGFVCVLRDVTRRREAEREVRHMAHHDALTGLANRHELHARLAAMLDAVPEAGPVHVLCLDLDRFKEVNDRLGHAVGDEVLREVARRLRGFPWMAGCGLGTVAARLGGDEFAVALQGDLAPSALAERLRHLVQHLSGPMEVQGHRVAVGASVGVALHPAHGDTPLALLQVADAALYRAKHTGRGRAVLHPPHPAHAAPAAQPALHDAR